MIMLSKQEKFILRLVVLLIPLIYGSLTIGWKFSVGFFIAYIITRLIVNDLQ